MNIKIYTNKGFSLIELMVVIAIIGILAAIAMPSYRMYVQKSKLTEVISLADADRTKLAAYFSVHGIPASSAEATTMMNEISLSVCESDYIDTSDCKFNSNGLRMKTDTSLLPDIRLIYTPQESEEVIKWVCSYGSSSSTEGVKLLPSGCQQVYDSGNALW